MEHTTRLISAEGLAFERLAQFINDRMKMSHIYQPLMLIGLLSNHGTITVTQIAKEFLRMDPTQVEYYENITRKMPGTVLSNHGVVERQDDDYRLKGFSELSGDQVDQLIDLCEKRLDGFMGTRGERLWDHRRQSGRIRGSDRFNVLKGARQRCEVCGVLNSERALHVDHIEPRSRGGSSDPTNLQALCYKCNASKGNRDDTDFRNVAAEYDRRQVGCVFCEIPDKRILEENALAYAIRDQSPVTNQHTLIIPKRHIASYFDLFKPELNGINHLLTSLRSAITDEDSSVRSFNIGVNDGPEAGQTISHCHVHLIPRRWNDAEDPTGGVRGVIRGRQIP